MYCKLCTLQSCTIQVAGSGCIVVHIKRADCLARKAGVQRRRQRIASLCQRDASSIAIALERLGKVVYNDADNKPLCCANEIPPELPSHWGIRESWCVMMQTKKRFVVPARCFQTFHRVEDVCHQHIGLHCLGSLALLRHATTILSERVYDCYIYRDVHSTQSALMICQHCHSSHLQYAIRHTHSSLLSSSPSDRLDDFLGVCM